MTEIDFLNILLNYFYTQQQGAFLVQNMHHAFVGKNAPANINYERLSEQLYEDGLCYKEIRGPNAMNQSNVYGISTKGILLCNRLPKDFSEKGYSYYLLEIREKDKLNKKREELEVSNIKANLTVASSVQETNRTVQENNRKNVELADATETFYTRQTGFNRWQRNLTIAILISTASYTVISYFMLRNQKKQLEKEKTELQQQVKEIKSQIIQDSAFLKKLKGF